MTISESVIALATAGAEQAQPMSDLERAARAIVTRLGSDPDFPAFRGPPVILGQNIYGVPRPQVQRPLWTFFTAEAEAALSVLDI